MRVRYIGDYYKVSLRKGTVYEVTSIEQGWYRIVDETGESYLFPPENFAPMEPDAATPTDAPSSQ